MTLIAHALVYIKRVAPSQQQHKLYLNETKNLHFGKSIEIKSTINNSRN